MKNNERQIDELNIMRQKTDQGQSYEDELDGEADQTNEQSRGI